MAIFGSSVMTVPSKDVYLRENLLCCSWDIKHWNFCLNYSHQLYWLEVGEDNSLLPSVIIIFQIVPRITFSNQSCFSAPSQCMHRKWKAPNSNWSLIYGDNRLTSVWLMYQVQLCNIQNRDQQAKLPYFTLFCPLPVLYRICPTGPKRCIKLWSYVHSKIDLTIHSQITSYNVTAQSLAKRSVVRDSDYQKLPGSLTGFQWSAISNTSCAAGCFTVHLALWRFKTLCHLDCLIKVVASSVW